MSVPTGFTSQTDKEPSTNGVVLQDKDVARFCNRLSPWRRILGILVVWVLCLLLVAGFTLGYLASQEYRSPYRTVDPRVLPSLSLILAATLLFWLVLLRRYRQSTYFLEITGRGILVNLPGSDLKRLRWEEIDGIAVDVVQPRLLWHHLQERWRAWIFAKGTQAIELDENLDHLPEAISRLKAAVYPRLLKKFHQNFSSGLPVRFGPLTIQAEWLKIQTGWGRERSIPWQQISSLKVENGRLTIQQLPRRKTSLPVKAIPNLELLLEIVKQDLQL